MNLAGALSGCCERTLQAQRDGTAIGGGSKSTKENNNSNDNSAIKKEGSDFAASSIMVNPLTKERSRRSRPTSAVSFRFSGQNVIGNDNNKTPEKQQQQQQQSPPQQQGPGGDKKLQMSKIGEGFKAFGQGEDDDGLQPVISITEGTLRASDRDKFFSDNNMNNSSDENKKETEEEQIKTAHSSGSDTDNDNNKNDDDNRRKSLPAILPAESTPRSCWKCHNKW